MLSCFLQFSGIACTSPTLRDAGSPLRPRQLFGLSAGLAGTTQLPCGLNGPKGQRPVPTVNLVLRSFLGTSPRYKGAPDCGASERNDGGHTKARNHLNETADDSSTGAASPGDELHLPQPLHRPGLAARSLSAHAQGRRSRRGQPDGRGLCRAPGRELAGPAEPSQVWSLPSAGRATGPHPEGRWLLHASDRDTDLRGQGSSTGGGHGARTDLRAGLSGLLVRVPTRSVRASGATDLAKPAHATWGWMGRRA